MHRMTEKFRKYKLRAFFIALAVLAAGAYAVPVFSGRDVDRFIGYEAPKQPGKTYSEEEKAEIRQRFDSRIAGIVSGISERIRSLHLYRRSKSVASDIVDAGERFGSGQSSGGGLLQLPAPSFDESEYLPVPDGFELAEVVHVADGDTILIRPVSSSIPSSSLYGTESQDNQYVRLTGVNTYESSAAVRSGYSESTVQGEEASKYTKSIVHEGMPVWLSLGGSEDRDVYGRLLRIVWLEEPEAGDDDRDEAVASKSLNAWLLADGMAETLFIGKFRYRDLFTLIFNEAYAAKRGIWAYTERKEDAA